METGILKQIDLTTTTARYFFVAAQHDADQITVRSTQAFKPLSLTFKVSDLWARHHQVSAASATTKYEFNDDTNGLLTRLKTWVE